MMIPTSILAVLPWITPWLMGLGAAATSVPIVIHLLNRRRFRVVIWAAMDWLLAAHRRNARRLKFQRWFLLALRVLAILVLAAAIAQMFFACSPDSAFSRTLSGGKQVVIVLDDSYSMGYASPNQPSRFVQARDMTVKYLKGLNAGDKAIVIRTSEAASMANQKMGDPHRLESSVAEMTVSDAGTDLATALTIAADILKNDRENASSKRVILVTDLSESSLPTDAAAGGSTTLAPLKVAVNKVREASAALQVVDLGTDDQVNLAITKAEMKAPIAVAEEDVKLEATIFNGTNQTVSTVNVTVLVDGVKRPMETLPQIEQGKEASFITTVKFPTPGQHTVEFQIAPDKLPTDDVRRMVIDVQRDIPITIVDGKPSDGHRWSSTWAVQAMASAFGGYGANTVTDAQLGTVPINKQKVIIFSDAVAPDPAAVAALTEFVRSGGLLVVFPGEQTVATSGAWNDRLGSKGTKLLPADFGPLIEPKDENSPDGVGLDPMNYAHPSLRLFGEEIRKGKKFLLGSYTTRRYFQLAIPTGDESVEAVMRFRRDDGSLGGDPAILTRKVARGRVIEFATGLGSEWSGLTAGAGDFPPLLDQLIKNELSGGTDRFTMMVGEKLDLAKDVTVTGSWIAPRNTRVNISSERKQNPSGATTAPATASSEKQVERLYSDIPLKYAGFYGPENAAPVVAVNTDATEADIRHVNPSKFADALGIDAKAIAAQPASLEMALVNAAGLTAIESIGLQLLVMALVLFIVETILARMFSVYR